MGFNVLWPGATGDPAIVIYSEPLAQPWPHNDVTETEALQQIENLSPSVNLPHEEGKVIVMQMTEAILEFFKVPFFSFLECRFWIYLIADFSFFFTVAFFFDDREQRNSCGFGFRRTVIFFRYVSRR